MSRLLLFLSFLSVWVGIRSLPIDRNAAEQEAKAEVQEETGVTDSVR